MGKIKILDKKTSELIAAGEVVENPASVVKELIENAVDAGATKITVEIKDGGRSYIRITDNGFGMSKEDAKTAFIRHATSKIEKAEDLFSVNTMGFRGEALASICSVSKTELFTKEKGETDGTHIIVEGGIIKSVKDCGTPEGTTVIVRDLFYNTPARLMFLKKDSTEGAYVLTAVERQALSTPEVSVRFIKGGKEELFTSGDGQLKTAVYSVFGREFASGLLPLDYSEEGMNVTGLISKPLSSKPNRNMQIFFANKRNIKSRLLSAALEEGYKNSIMTGKFPSCVIDVTLDPSKVDVNVHPRKTEVKFSEESILYEFILRAVKNALEKDSGRQDFLVDIPRTAEFKQPITPPEIKVTEKKPEIDFFAIKEDKEVVCENLLRTETVIVNDQDLCIPWSIVPKSKEERKQITKETLISDAEQIIIKTEDKSFDKPYRYAGELFSTYLIAENGTAAILIDKHAAHERIIFEDLKKNVNNFSRQQLLTPITLNFSKIDCDTLISNSEKLADLGFLIEEFGTGTILVREVPDILEFSDTEAVLSEAAEILRRSGGLELKEIDEILHTIACKSAVRAGSFTGELEKEEFITKLMSLNNIKYCPHGRPVIVELTRQALEKMFKRIV